MRASSVFRVRRSDGDRAQCTGIPPGIRSTSPVSSTTTLWCGFPFEARSRRSPAGSQSGLEERLANGTPPPVQLAEQHAGFAHRCPRPSAQRDGVRPPLVPRVFPAEDLEPGVSFRDDRITAVAAVKHAYHHLSWAPLVPSVVDFIKQFCTADRQCARASTPVTSRTFCKLPPPRVLGDATLPIRRTGGLAEQAFTCRLLPGSCLAPRTYHGSIARSSLWGETRGPGRPGPRRFHVETLTD